MMQEAYGVMQRNNLKDSIKEQTQEKLKKVEYKKQSDTLIRPDTFSTVSAPSKDFVSLPTGKGKKVRVEMISTEEDVQKLDDLFEEAFIGVDTEWKPYFGPQNTKTEVAIMQLSTNNCVFVIDMIALKNSKNLDDYLYDLFSQRQTTIVGFGFENDLDQLIESLP